MKSTYDLFMSLFENGRLGNVRKKLISKVSGHILEVGSGTGVNLKLYDHQVSGQLTDIEINKILEARAQGSQFQCQKASVMNLPYKNQSFDMVVSTLVFCSVEDVDIGLHEIHRTLKDDGFLIFIEHVEPQTKYNKWLFNTITPLWKKMASGCHLNRDYLASLEKNNFEVIEVNQFYKGIFVAGMAKKRASV